MNGRLVDVLKGVGKSEEQKDKAKGAAGARGRSQFDIQADEATNALVITAPPDIMRTLKRVISQLDIRRAQVLVEAIIAEVSLEIARELGVQWLFSGAENGSGPVGLINFTNTGSTITNILNGLVTLEDGGSLPTPDGNVLLGGGRIDHPDFNYIGVLNALNSDTDTNILSTPTLVMLDNEEAEIIIGQNVPFRTGSFTQGNEGSSNPFNTVQREDVGLSLKIKPQINEGNALKLDIEQEVSSIAESTANNDIITNKRAIKTSVMVEDGQMVVLGGLIEEQVRESEQKVPLLGDVPLLGALFRSRSSDVNRTNLMVFIHPVILRDAALTTQYTNSKYTHIRQMQMISDEDGINLQPRAHIPVLPLDWDNPDAPEAGNNKQESSTVIEEQTDG